jgi:ABC-type antimicrobial peptide transport system permease subunit
VVVRHALKNAPHPRSSPIFGLQFGNLLAGAVIVETVFSRPGLGRLIVGGILSKDFPLVQGTVLFVATTYVLINLLVDIAYAYADPASAWVGRDGRREPGPPAGAPSRRAGGPVILSALASWPSPRPG